MPDPSATVSEFKARFVRDFVYGSGADKVMDADITVALADAAVMFNAALWESTAETKIPFLLLAAHVLVLNIKAAGGLSATNMGLGVNAEGEGVVASKSVGPVSLTYANSPTVVENKVLSGYLRTAYGQRYLELLMPRLIGNVAVVAGWNDVGAQS